MLSEPGLKVSHMVHKKPSGTEGSITDSEAKELGRKRTSAFLRNLGFFREHPQKAEQLACPTSPLEHMLLGNRDKAWREMQPQGSRVENSLAATTVGGCGLTILRVIAAPTEGQAPS